MGVTKIAPFEPTPVESIASTVNLCRTSFRSQKTKPLSYRLAQLRKLYWGIVDNSDALLEACKQDLGKPEFEAWISEIDWCKNDIVFVQKNLEKWMKDEAAPDMPLTNSLLKPTIRKEPLGTVLVIGAFNFPVMLTFGPFIGAIAAGCTAVVKPSELSSATAMVIKKIVTEYLDPSSYAVVNGAIPETTTLLNEKWDKIFYTGSPPVGTIIAKKAAETLTPVTLELGGLNPAIITKNADPRLAARRLLWSKLHNAGQVCISQNYVMVEKEVLPAFVEQLKITMKEFFPDGVKKSPDFARIVNNRHFHRIKKMLDGTRGKILFGGDIDESENYIGITVIQVPDANDSLIVDESFGPLIPILVVDNVDSAIRTANSVDPTPLALYAFGSKAETNKSMSNFPQYFSLTKFALPASFKYLLFAQLTYYSPQRSHVRRCLHQRRLLPRLHPHARIRRRGNFRARLIQRQSLLRHVHPRALHHHHSRLDGEDARSALPAVFRQAAQSPQHDRPEAELHSRWQGDQGPKVLARFHLRPGRQQPQGRCREVDCRCACCGGSEEGPGQ